MVALLITGTLMKDDGYIGGPSFSEVVGWIILGIGVLAAIKVVNEKP